MLDMAKDEVRKLHSKVEMLVNRPTHMDLLADFETNFDRALLSMHPEQREGGQSGGENPSSTNVSSIYHVERDESNCEEGGSSMQSMLMTELSEVKSRMEQLEGLNAALLSRNSKLEKMSGKMSIERDSGRFKFLIPLTYQS